MSFFIKGRFLAFRPKSRPPLHDYNLHRLMRIGTIFLSIFFAGSQLLMAKPGTGQNIEEVTVTLGFKNESLQTALKKIEKASNFFFAYQTGQVAGHKGIDLPKQTRTISATLKLILANTNLSFHQEGDYILIYQKPP